MSKPYGEGLDVGDKGQVRRALRFSGGRLPRRFAPRNDGVDAAFLAMNDRWVAVAKVINLLFRA